MATAVNKVILIGNLGKDPEIRTLETGTKLATFTMATTESYKDKEGNFQDKTEWHRVVAWRYSAEFAEKYLKKGTRVYIEGKLSTRTYEQDSVQKYITEIVAREIITMTPRTGEGGSYNTPPAPNEEPMQQAQPTNTSTTTPKKELDSDLQAGSDEVDDLPF